MHEQMGKIAAAATAAAAGGAPMIPELPGATESAAWDARMRPMLDASFGCSPLHVLEPLSLRIRVALDFQGSLTALSAWANLTFLSPLSMAVRHQQLLDLLALTEALDAQARRAEHRECLRPAASPSVQPAQWWAYIGRCAMLQRRRAGGMRLTWAGLKERRARRHAYLELYARARGKRAASAEMKELQAFEASMDFDEIVAFRRIGLRAYQEARKTQGLVGGLMGALFFRDTASRGGVHAGTGGLHLKDEEIEGLYAALEESDARMEEERRNATVAAFRGGGASGGGAHAGGASGGGASGGGTYGLYYEQFRASISSARHPVQLTLYHTQAEPLLSLVIGGLAARAATRPVGEGASLAASIRSIDVLDLTSELRGCPQRSALRHVLTWDGSGVQPLDHVTDHPTPPSTDATPCAISLVVDFRPVDSSCSAHVDLSLGYLRANLNPLLVTPLSRFFSIPQSHLAAAQAVEQLLEQEMERPQGLGTSLAAMMRDVALALEYKPARVRARLAGIQLVLVQPPTSLHEASPGSAFSPLRRRQVSDVGGPRFEPSASDGPNLLRMLLVRLGTLNLETLIAGQVTAFADSDDGEDTCSEDDE